MGHTFHRKHYDKFNYGNDDYEGFKKRRKKNDRRPNRHKVIADKHETVNTPTVWVKGNEFVTE